jgi:hypothetical protein
MPLTLVDDLIRGDGLANCIIETVEKVVFLRWE